METTKEIKDSRFTCILFAIEEILVVHLIFYYISHALYTYSEIENYSWIVVVDIL